MHKDTLGRFLPGNPGGPGRPRRDVERRYLAVLSEAVSVETWRAIVARAADDALAGDPAARQWLGAYLLGQPRNRIEVGPIVDEFAAFDHLSDEELRRIASGAPEDWPAYALQTPEQLRAAHGLAEDLEDKNNDT
jgi:hypothetical protein